MSSDELTPQAHVLLLTRDEVSDRLNELTVAPLIRTVRGHSPKRVNPMLAEVQLFDSRFRLLDADLPAAFARRAQVEAKEGTFDRTIERQTALVIVLLAGDEAVLGVTARASRTFGVGVACLGANGILVRPWAYQKRT